MIRFTVPGIPAPKGSFRSFKSKRTGRQVVVNDNARTAPWQNVMAWAAVNARGSAEPLQGPIVVYAAFYLPRPKSAPKTRTGPVVKPDKDKLLRAVYDALKLARIYVDDQQVLFGISHKAYAGGPDDFEGPGGIPRAFIAVGSYHVGRPGMFGLIDQLVSHVSVAK